MILARLEETKVAGGGKGNKFKLSKTGAESPNLRELHQSYLQAECLEELEESSGNESVAEERECLTTVH